MEKITAAEKKVRDYYENIWSPPIQVEGRDENPLLGFHYGLYEKGIKNWKEAAINMNDFVGRLLKLDNTRNIEILDVGCGIGSTSVYLAMKYSNVKFTGITLAPSEIKFAKKIQKDNRVTNAEFIEGSYLKTFFPSEYFDGVFAIESFGYAQNKKGFIFEMKRILKPGKKLIILDGFRTDKSIPSFLQRVYSSFLSRRALPNLMSLNDFIQSLDKEGFKQIDIIDLTKANNLMYNFLQLDFFKILINFFLLQFKKAIKGNSYKSKEDIYFVLGALVPELILGMGKKIGYYGVTAVKK